VKQTLVLQFAFTVDFISDELLHAQCATTSSRKIYDVWE
jgi:hypothetical protein